MLALPLLFKEGLGEVGSSSKGSLWWHIVVLQEESGNLTKIGAAEDFGPLNRLRVFEFDDHRKLRVAHWTKPGKGTVGHPS